MQGRRMFTRRNMQGHCRWNNQVRLFGGGSGWGGTNVSCQLNFRLFVSCQLNFGPFVSCQLNVC